MRLPRVQFTVGRIMVAVAIVAVLLGGWCVLERRRARFESLAIYYESLAIYWESQIENPTYHDTTSKFGSTRNLPCGLLLMDGR
jgi:hypothetical protein